MATYRFTVDVPVQPPSPAPFVRCEAYIGRQTGRLPVIEVLPGASHTRWRMTGYARRFASHGGIALACDRRTAVETIAVETVTLGRSHSDWTYAWEGTPSDVAAADALEVLRWVVRQGSTQGSPFAGRVDPGRLGLIGYSLGAYTAQVAALRSRAEGPRLRAVVLIDPGKLVASSSDYLSGEEQAMSRMTTPTAMILLEGSFNSARLWSKLPHTLPKLGVWLFSTPHDRRIADQDPATRRCHGAPSWVCSEESTPRTDGLVLTQRYGLAWLYAWLRCDRTVLPYLNGPAADHDEVSRQDFIVMQGSSAWHELPLEC